jgi:hypothetical protein
MISTHKSFNEEVKNQENLKTKDPEATHFQTVGSEQHGFHRASPLLSV